jgi:hypothetical protein
MLQLAGPIYEMPPVRKYVLVRLNELLASAPVHFNPKIMTVEHVLPQNPRQDSTWTAEFTEAERNYWVHRLGNLVLLDRKKNSEAQNFDFEVKKKRYFRSASGVTPFTLTMGVIDTNVWTPTVIKTRQRRMLGVLADAWDIARDSDGNSLAELSEADLALAPDVQAPSFRRAPRVTVADLLAADLLEVEMELVWARPRLGEEHHAWVTESGQLRLVDGRLFDTPSRAAREAAGRETVDGWDSWVLPNGQKIGQVWQDYQTLRAASDETMHAPL